MELKKTNIESSPDNHYKLLFDAMTEMVTVLEIIYDKEGKPLDSYIRDVNISFAKLFNKTKEELIDKKITELADIIENYWLPYFVSVDKTGKAIQFKSYGAEFEKHYFVSAWKIPDNRIGVSFTCITESEKAEIELKKTLKKAQKARIEKEKNLKEKSFELRKTIDELDNTVKELAFKNIEKNRQTAELQTIKKKLEEQNYCLNKAAIVTETDVAGNIIFANDNFCKFYGYKREEVIGKNHKILKSGKQSDSFFTEMMTTIHSGKTFKDIIINKDKEGKNLYWMDLTIIPYKDLNGKIIKFLGIMFNVTAQVKQKETLLKHTEELAQANNKLAFQNEDKDKRANELILANQEKDKRANELIKANTELAFQNKEKDRRANELAIAKNEKEKRAEELNIANKELAYQNKEKDKRANELILANTEKDKRVNELNFAEKEKKERINELAIANKEKEKRASELILANKELAYQNKEKDKRANELILANTEKDKRVNELNFAEQEKKERINELAIANKEKEKRASELILANKELAYQNKEKDKRASELILANTEKDKRVNELNLAEQEKKERINELAIANKEKENRANELILANKEKDKRIEELAIAKELRQFIETSNTPVFGINNAGFINEWNQATEKITGFKKNEVLGQLWSEFTPEDSEKNASKILHLALNGKQTANFEFFARNKNGKKLILLVNTSARRDAVGQIKGVLAVGQDITELVGYRNQLEKKVAERTTKLNQALEKQKELNKLKSKFVSTASHEFRTPLSAINFAAGSIKKYWGKMDPTVIEKKLFKIEDQVLHMTRLLDDILIVGQADAKKIKNNPVPTHLGNFIKNIIDEVYISRKKSHKIELIDTKNIKDTTIFIDKMLGRNIFTNLISNAIKYSPNGEKVTVEISSDKKYIIISVSDLGIGISPEELKTVFTPFSRGKNVDLIQGTGLGLSIAKEAVDAIKGKINVKSIEGNGTSFIVKIRKNI